MEAKNNDQWNEQWVERTLKAAKKAIELYKKEPPEGGAFNDLVAEARAFIAKNQPRTIPPGEWYKDGNGTSRQVPEGFFYFTRERKLKKVDRQGSRNGVRVGCYATRITVEER